MENSFKKWNLGLLLDIPETLDDVEMLLEPSGVEYLFNSESFTFFVSQHPVH